MTGRRTGTRMEVDLTGRCDLGENYFYAPPVPRPALRPPRRFQYPLS